MNLVFWFGAEGSGGPNECKKKNIFIVVSKAV
jgi:hypothetical protein